VFRNTGGSFVDWGGTLPLEPAPSASWGDFDEDGDLDLLLGSTLLRNDHNVSNTLPTVPTDLSVTRLSKHEVRLNWTAATDGESGPHGLSYNMRVGKTPGSSDVMSPQTAEVDGHRSLPQNGNAGQINFWRLTLPYGEYFWSVQAIDGGFASSPFAAEHRFVVSNRPPVAASIARQTSEDKSITIILGGTDIDGDALTYSIQLPPTNGTLTGTSPFIRYQPFTNFVGEDSFTFVAGDGESVSAPALVSIRVMTNTPPVATPSEHTISEDTSILITLRGTDVDGGPLTYAIQSPPTNGTLSGGSPFIRYRPAVNFFGQDSFTFVAQDGQSVSFPALVSITVTPVADVAVSKLAIRWMTNSFQISGKGEPRQNYVIEMSTNLTTWNELQLIQCDALSGAASFSETNTSGAQRFYRLRAAP